MKTMKYAWYIASCVTFFEAGILAQIIFGGSEGFLADCPGSDLPIEIPTKDLNNLLFVVFNTQAGIYRRAYGYSEAVNRIANDSMIDWKKKTVLYAPGYMDSAKYAPAIMMGVAYSKLGYNVLLLDTIHFTTGLYPLAARFTRTIGRYAATVLANLVPHGLNPKMLEIIGMSLGGHIASFTGKQFQTLTSTKISRITGLDPAGPCFRNLPPSSRLDSSDADFVDVIHTNANGLGGAKPWGHVDFYVNGGGYQVPDIPAIPCAWYCSHARSVFLWPVALMRPRDFIGMKCDSRRQAENLDCYSRSPRETNTMGLLTNKSLTGIFLLNTSNKYPYALGNRGLSKQSEYVARGLANQNKSLAQ